MGLRTSADVLMKEAGCRLVQPTAATFRHCVMKGDWTGAVNGKIRQVVVLYFDSVSVLRGSVTKKKTKQAGAELSQAQINLS